MFISITFMHSNYIFAQIFLCIEAKVKLIYFWNVFLSFRNVFLNKFLLDIVNHSYALKICSRIYWPSLAFKIWISHFIFKGKFLFYVQPKSTREHSGSKWIGFLFVIILIFRSQSLYLPFNTVNLNCTISYHEEKRNASPWI